MRLYLRLAWRNVWRHRRRTLIVVVAMGFTLAMMMMYDGLIAGFEQAIYGNAIKVLGGNIQVHASGYNAELDQMPLLPLQNDQALVEAARAQPQVVAAARRINTGGLATTREGAFAATVIGIDPVAELPISVEAQNVIAGRYLQTDDLDVIFIGKGLADAMDVGLGERITLVSRATHSQMRKRTMTVVGIYDLGMADIEKGTIYISLGEAQDLLGLNGQSTEVVIFLEQLGQEAEVMKALDAAVPGYEMASWQTNFPELVAAMTRKTSVMNVFSVIILAIAGIGILNLLLMAVYERTREIGLMGALGVKPIQISGLFLLEGALMGLLGAAFGILLGLAFNFLFSRVGFDYSQFSSLTEYMALVTGRVYPTLGIEHLFPRTLTVVIIAVLAASYPAREASHREPAEALHYV